MHLLPLRGGVLYLAGKLHHGLALLERLPDEGAGQRVVELILPFCVCLASDFADFLHPDANGVDSKVHLAARDGLSEEVAGLKRAMDGLARKIERLIRRKARLELWQRIPLH